MVRVLAVVALCLAAAMWATPALAADGTWLGTDGNWSDPGTWSGGTIADGTDFTANFTGVDITADQTITLDTARVIGNITFTDAATASNNLTISGANTLLLDVTTGAPTIDVTQSGRTLTIDSLIGGNDGLTKAGAGTLILSGANTGYSGTTTISAGELVATADSTFTPFGTGTVDIGANILTLSPSSTAANSTLANTLTGTGTLNINPAAGRNMILSGTLSGFTGTVNVAANTGFAKLTTGSVTPGSGAIVNIASGATWFMNGGTHSGITANLYGTGNTENLGALRMDGGTISNTSSVVLKADGSVGANSGTGTINAVISDGGGGYSLTKQGAGTIVLGAINTYTGATIIDKGMLTLANVSALANTSAITIAGGATLRSTVDAVVISAPITLGASGTTSTINAPAIGSTGGTVYTMTLNGAISGAGNLTLTGVQGNNVYGTIILGAASDYAGSTLFTTDTNNSNKNIFVNLGIDNALPATTVLTLDGQNGTGTSPGRYCVLNLNGHDQTLAGLTNVARSLRVQAVRNTSDTPATLTINDSGNRTFSGQLGNGGANFGLTKSGSGTWTISGVNTYTGATTVNAGTLTLDYSTNNTSKLANGAALVLGGGTVNLSGGTHTEIVASTTLTAGTLSSVTRAAGSTAVLQMGDITRGAGAAIDFGGGGIATTNTTNIGGILFGATINGADWATNSTNDPNGLIVAYTGYADVTRLDSGTKAIADDSASNVRIVEGTGSPAGITLGAATTTINTLNQSAVDGGSAATIDPAGQTLRTNIILVGTGAGGLTIGTGTNNGTLSAAIAGGELSLANVTGNGITINSDIADNSGSSLTVYSGTVTLAGANTYTGTTSIISASALQLGKRASLYNGATGSWTAANIKVAGNATLALNVGGTGEFTTDDVTTLLTNLGGVNGTSTTGFAAGSKIVFDTTNASGGPFTVAASIADSTGTGGGVIDVTKLGANTLALAGLSATAANNYSGTTTIGAGTLAISANDPSFTGGLTFGSANASTTVGSLDLSTSSATYAGSALVRTDNAAANTVLIGDGRTLTLNGGLTMGYDAAGGTGQTDSKLTVTGLGSMAVNGTTINISVNQAATNAAYWSKGTLDVSGLAAFSTNVTNFNIGVGSTTQGPGDVLLSNTANTILATTLAVGVTGANNGRGTSTLTLGTGTNVIQADTINIGRNKNSGPGVVKFASQTAGSPGTVTISNKAGTGRANIDIANQVGTATGGGAVGTLDLRGHVATVSAGTVTIGNVSATSNTGGPNGKLYFDAGTFDVNTLNLAPKSGGSTGTARATVDIGGGSFTVNTAFTLGSQAGSGASVATLNLTGGTLSTAVSILDGGGNTTSKITIDGGTVNMNGNAIGGATAIDTLEFKSGGLQNVSEINNGVTGLTKIATGTLVLSGTNTYTGGTTVDGGTLLVSGAVAMPTAGTLQVNAGGNFSLADGTASSSTTAALGLASGSTLTFDWNAANLDTLTSTTAATTAGTVGIILSSTSPTGSGGTLISSASGGLTTANGTQYFLVNNTDYTATLTVTDTDVSIGAQSAATALTDAYWKGGQLTGGALGAMALSSGVSNWASDAAGTSAAGVVPGGSTVNVIFGAMGATEQANVTTGADMNLGSITFNDSAAVTVGGSNAITLNSTSAAAATSSGSGTTVTPGSAVTVTSSANAANTIQANIQLAANQTWNIAGGKTLTVSGIVGGTGALTLADGGTLILTGANAYTGATTISGGTLQLGDGTTGKDGTIGNTSGVTNNGALVYNGFGSSIAGYAISGTGTVTKQGAGVLTLSGTNSYTGVTTISAGTLQFANEVSLYNNNTSGTGWTAANIVVGNSGTLALNVGGTGEFTTGDVTTLLTNLGGANGTGTAGFAAGSKIAFDTTGGNFTVADLIADSSGSGGGAIGLTKLGANTLTLSGDNGYTGATTVDLGTLAITHNNAMGTTAGATTVNGGNGTNAVSISLSSATTDLTIAENLNFFGNTAGRAQLVNNSAQNHTLSGAIDVTSATNLVQFSSSNNTGSITISGDITGTLTDGATFMLRGTSTSVTNRLIGNINLAGDLMKTDAGTWLVGAPGKTYSWGNTIVAVGILKMGLSNILPSAGTLTMGNPTGGSTGTLDLNGFDQTVASIIYNGVGSTTGTRTITSATAAVLTVNNATDNPSLGSGANSVVLTGSLGLTKAGVGMLTLTAANTYTGDTKVEAGTLSITNAYLSDLADVYLTTGAIFNLDFTGTDTIDELFFNGAGQLSGTWGSLDSGAQNKSAFFTGDGLLSVTTSGILPGDTNEDRVVDAADFITLKRNFGAGIGGGVGVGNFDNTGTVNWTDLNTLMTNIGVSDNAPATTPEPATLFVMMAAGLPALLKRRRRRS